MTKEKLGPDDIAAALARLDGWARSADGGAIEKVWEFRDFRAGFAFLTQVALLAERLNHHPDLAQSWRRVTLRLTSHDTGGLTGRDMDMARKIDSLNITPE